MKHLALGIVAGLFGIALGYGLSFVVRFSVDVLPHGGLW